MPIDIRDALIEALLPIVGKKAPLAADAVIVVMGRWTASEPGE
jgi:hypothetical protein